MVKLANLAEPQTCLAYAFPTELGWMCVAWGGERLSALVFGHSDAGRAVQALADPVDVVGSERLLPDFVQQTVQRLRRFAAGGSDDFLDVPINLDPLSPFQSRVVEACRRIKSGSVRSYAALADVAGSPRAARAVGNVMRSNRYPLIVPCHRVVGADGRLCGFTSPQGLAMKQRLLEREGVYRDGRCTV
jgi:methylated-DNA-[protein]-cysteine S-methyltransferase